MFQIIGSIFIAQLNDKDLSTSDYFLAAYICLIKEYLLKENIYLLSLSFLTYIASLTVAGIPSGGLVTIVLIISGLNINQNQVGLIFTVDWFM